MIEVDECEPDERIEAFAASVDDTGVGYVLHRYAETAHWFGEPDVLCAHGSDAAAPAMEQAITQLAGNLRPG